MNGWIVRMLTHMRRLLQSRSKFTLATLEHYQFPASQCTTFVDTRPSTDTCASGQWVVSMIAPVLKADSRSFRDHVSMPRQLFSTKDCCEGATLHYS